MVFAAVTAMMKESENMARLNFKGLSVAELVDLRDKVQAELSRKIGTERSALEAQIAALAKLEGGGALVSEPPKAARTPRAKASVATATDREGSTAKSPVAPKFRGPTGETWTGRGRAPRWLMALEADGHSRETYRIAPAAPAARSDAPEA